MVMTFLRGWLAGGVSGVLAGVVVGTAQFLVADPGVGALVAGVVLGGFAGAAVGICVGLVAAVVLALLSLAVRRVWQARLAGAVAAVVGSGALLWRLGLGLGLDLAAVVFFVMCAAIGAGVGRIVVFGKTQPV